MAVVGCRGGLRGRGRRGNCKESKRGLSRAQAIGGGIVDDGLLIQTTLVGGVLASAAAAAVANGLKEVEPKVCPVCRGSGGETCVPCNGTGVDASKPQLEPVRTVAPPVRGRDAELGVYGVIGRNPNECKCCLGSGMKLCKTCGGTGFVSRM